MKYLIMLGDGMADHPQEKLGGHTPLQMANKPRMDYLAAHGCVGMAKTIPDGMAPGSDNANIAALGYDPTTCYTGRSPLEAVSMGITLAEDDVAFRCNLVTLTDEEDIKDATMLDYSAGEITTAESRELVTWLARELCGSFPGTALYPGVSYRHCLVLSHAKPGCRLTPPHDILGRCVREYLPGGEYGEMLLAFIERSRELLKNHPINQARIAAGKNPANSCWFWGEGTKPGLANFEATYGLKGGMISAVDLLKGIGICAGMKVVNIPGATGNLETNFAGKAEAAVKMFKEGLDLVYIHVEAPDECGHQGDVPGKVQAIEEIDRQILTPVTDALKAMGEDYSVLLMPDHPTPLELRTHVAEPVPFVLYNSTAEQTAHAVSCYTEDNARGTGVYLDRAWDLMGKLVSGRF